MSLKGKHIVLEGVDLSGKSTMAQLLCSWATGMGHDAILVRNPGATPLGAEIRRIVKSPTIPLDPISEALLFAADNAAFCDQILRPNLNAGKWVISDRNNFISSLAYQLADGCKLDQLDKVHDTIDSPPKIDLLIVLKVPWETIAERRKQRNIDNDRWDKRGKEYHERLMASYEDLIELHKERLNKFINPTTDLSDGNVSILMPRCLFIDAARDVNEVFNSILEAVKAIR